MDEIIWSDLIQIYLHTNWNVDGTTTINVANLDILRFLQLIDGSDDEYDKTQISVTEDIKTIKVGDIINVDIGHPKASMGLLVDNWDFLLTNALFQLDEPKAYFIKEDSTHSPSEDVNEKQNIFREVISLVKLFSKAGLYTDQENRRIVFHNQNRVDLPLILSGEILSKIDIDACNEINNCLIDNLHEDQKVQILSRVIVELISTIKEDKRLNFLLSNLDEVARRLVGGYQIFVSSFSYNKIRSEIETAQAEYVSKIHKTFTDIQGQILGLPIAAFVVVSQLKPVTVCGSELWVNIAILIGAWVFVILLVMSCVNQWFTLAAIKNDLKRQAARLSQDYSDVGRLFNGAFKSVHSRIYWHKFALIFIAALGVVGAIIASLVFSYLLPKAGNVMCLSQPVHISPEAIWALMEL